MYKLSSFNDDHEITLTNSIEKSNPNEKKHFDILNHHLLTSDVSDTEISITNKEDPKYQVEVDVKRGDNKKKNKTRNKTSKNNKKTKKHNTKRYKFTMQFVPLRSTHKFGEDTVSESFNQNDGADKSTNKNLNKNIHLIGDKLNSTKLKDNTKIYNFIIHIFKQSLNIFDKMKELADDVGKKQKIELLKILYIEKFGEFVNETEKHKLKTKLSTQNVILNVIDVSNNILKRLVSHLYIDNQDTKENNIKRNTDILKVFEREIKKESDIENKHACNKLGVCRKDDEYSDFIIKVISIILQTDDYKNKQATNSMTETVKNSDLTNLVDYETEKKLRKTINDIEMWEASLIRSMFVILNTVIKNKNRPISVIDKIDIKLANRTVAFYDLLNIMNENMGTVENKVKQRECIKGLEDWRDGKRKNVQSSIEAIIKQMIEGLEKLDYEIRKVVNDVIKLLVKR